MTNKPGVQAFWWFLRRRFLLSVVSFSVVLISDVAELVDVAMGARAIGAFKPNVTGYVATAGLFVVTEGIADAIRALNGQDRSYPWAPNEESEEI